uniref:Uncharacterized protein n=1 Tax=Lotharella globosa TaxID=91324 RepID=A0A7S4DZQ2_9EUKA
MPVAMKTYGRRKQEAPWAGAIGCRGEFLRELSIPSGSRREIVDTKALSVEDIVDDCKFLHSDREQKNKSSKNRHGGKCRSSSGVAVRQMRRRNLSQKSMTQLLFETVSGRSSSVLRQTMENLVRGGSGHALVTKVNRRHFDAMPDVECACFIGNSTKGAEMVTQYLLDAAADPNKCDPDRRTPMVIAVHLRNSTRLVRLLLNRRGCPNSRFQNKSLVDLALELGHKDALRLLLERGVC